MLIELARICSREADVTDMVQERERLTRMVNDRPWDEGTHFCYDLCRMGSETA